MMQLLAYLGLLIGLVASSSCRSLIPLASAQQKSSPESNTFWEVQLQNPRVKGQLLSDDGFAAAIFYGGNMMGSLETCG